MKLSGAEKAWMAGIPIAPSLAIITWWGFSLAGMMTPPPEELVLGAFVGIACGGVSAFGAYTATNSKTAPAPPAEQPAKWPIPSPVKEEA